MSRRLSDCPLPAGTRSPFQHPVEAGHARSARFPPPPATALHTPSHPYIVGRGLDPSAGRRGRRPLQRWPETTPHPRTFRPAPAHPSAPCRGRACPARNLPAACRQSSTAHPHNLCPPTAVTPIYTLPKLHPQTLSKKSKKTCKNLLTKVILLAIIIKLSREPSPRRQPLEPLPTACTPFFEENFFKKLSENLLTNERI